MYLEFAPTIILTLHWLIVVGLSLRVIARRPPVGVALAWLAVIFSVPFVGAYLYLLFGGVSWRTAAACSDRCCEPRHHHKECP